MRATKINTGAVGSLPVSLPIHKRGKAWAIMPARIAIHEGQTAEDATTFAAAIVASFEAHRAVWLARHLPATGQSPASVAAPAKPAPSGCTDDCARLPRHRGACRPTLRRQPRYVAA